MTIQFGHVGPHEILGPFNPFQLISKPSKEGIPFGIMENGQSFWLDVHLLMRRRLTGGTSVQFMGSRDSGKTTAAQVYAARNSVLTAGTSGIRRRVSVDDTRRNAGVPEYAGFANYLGGNHIDLSHHKLNYLDPKMGQDVLEQNAVVRSACETVSGEKLTNSERVALLVAIDIMNRETPDFMTPEILADVTLSNTLEDYKLFLRRSSGRMLYGATENVALRSIASKLDTSMNISQEEFLRASRRVHEMQLLLLDEHAVFGGENSLYDVLSSPVVALDLTGLDDETVPLVEMLLWSWRNAAVRRHDHNLMAHSELHDEAWKRWENLTYGRNMINHLKKIRGSGSVIIKVMHRPSDVLQAGAVGTRQQELAISGLRETDIWFIGKMNHSDLDDVRKYVQLPRKYLEMLPRLGVGEFVCKIGERMPPFRFYLELQPDELEMSQTNMSSQDMALDY